MWKNRLLGPQLYTVLANFHLLVKDSASALIPICPPSIGPGSRRVANEKKKVLLMQFLYHLQPFISVRVDGDDLFARL